MVNAEIRAQPRRRSAPHGHAGSARLRRDGAVRREVRRARARAAHGRFLDRAVRRHARRTHRRHRPVQDRLRGRRRRRRAPHRGGDRAGRAATTSPSEERRLDEAARLLGGKRGRRRRQAARSCSTARRSSSASSSRSRPRPPPAPPPIWPARRVDVGGVKVVAARLEGFDAKACARRSTGSSSSWAMP